MIFKKEGRNMKQMRFVAGVLACVFCVSTLSGCIVLGVGMAAGYVGYEKGALVAAMDNSVEDVYNATLEALDDMGIGAIAKILRHHESKVQFYSKFDGKKSTIQAEALTEYTCKLTIRVGFFGNDIAAQKILDSIRAKL